MIESIVNFLNCNLDVGNVVAFFSLFLSGIAIYLSVRKSSTLTIIADAGVDSFSHGGSDLGGSELLRHRVSYDFDISVLLLNRGNASFYLDYVKLLGPEGDQGSFNDYVKLVSSESAQTRPWVSWAGDMLQTELPANSSKAVRLKFHEGETQHDDPDVFLLSKPDQFQLKCEVRLFMPDGIEHIISVPMTVSTDENHNVTGVTAKPEKLKYHSLRFLPSLKLKRTRK